MGFGTQYRWIADVRDIVIELHAKTGWVLPVYDCWLVVDDCLLDRGSVVAFFNIKLGGEIEVGARSMKVGCEIRNIGLPNHSVSLTVGGRPHPWRQDAARPSKKKK